MPKKFGFHKLDVIFRFLTCKNFWFFLVFFSFLKNLSISGENVSAASETCWFPKSKIAIIHIFWAFILRSGGLVGIDSMLRKLPGWRLERLRTTRLYYKGNHTIKKKDFKIMERGRSKLLVPSSNSSIHTVSKLMIHAQN